MAKFENAFQLILPHFMEVMTTRNYNGHAYMIINDEWKLLKGSELCESTTEYSKYFTKNKTFITSELYTRLLPHFSVMHSTNCNFKKFHKRIMEYIVNHVPNSAENDDMTPQVNAENDLVEMMKINVLLPREQLLEIVSNDFPEILTNPSVEKVVFKYIHLFAYNHILHFIRRKIKDEFAKKKAIPIPTRYRGIRVEDDLYLQKKIILDDILHINNQISNIKSILEVMLFKEMEMEGVLSSCKWLNMYITYFRSCGESNIPVFCEKWWEYSPEFLSDSTNYLTHYDKKLMESIPILLQKLLEDINHIFHNEKVMKNLKKLEKSISYV